jgi:hypothetical protein
MELKVLCDCGQKFKFDVEPANGRMPYAINCPTCNADATEKANSVMAENLARVSSPSAAAPPPIAPVSGGLRLHRSEPVAASAPPTLTAMSAASTGFSPPSRPAASQPKSSGEFNLGLGILGAVLGAGIASAVMYGFFLWANFRFPLMGTLVGALTGYGARILYKGTDSTLGAISAVIAVLATCGTLFLMYGEVGGLFFISIAVSGYFAYRVAS